MIKIILSESLEYFLSISVDFHRNHLEYCPIYLIKQKYCIIHIFYSMSNLISTFNVIKTTSNAFSIILRVLIYTKNINTRILLSR